MIHVFKKFINRVRRKLRRMSDARSDVVNFDDFAEEVAIHRARGVKIGQKVRLLGHIDSVNPHLVTVGDYVVLGAHSALLTHCPIKGAQAVSVGAYSYISYGALILPGVSIGECCVVGAGAVVTRSVPDGTIVAGNPARVLRSLTPDEKAHMIDVMHKGRRFGQVFGLDQGTRRG